MKKARLTLTIGAFFNSILANCILTIYSQLVKE